MFTRRRSTNEFEPAQCPVCRALFGRRNLAAIYKAHCADCKATYWWKPWASKPSAILDSYKPHRGYCGPDGCVCRS